MNLPSNPIHGVAFPWMIHWIVWLFLPLIRAPLRHNEGGCMFAAIAKHIELQLRIVAARAMPPRALLDDHLVDQDDLMQRFLSSEPANGSMSTVLEFVANHGVKLVTGQLLYVRFDIQRYPFVGRRSESVIDELGRWLGNGTILGTLAIHDDYPRQVDKVYLGLGRRLCVERQGRPDYEVNHSVVILGVFNVDSTLAAGWSCPVGNYFVYQDSKGPQYRGLMGFGRTLGHPRVLLKVYQAPLLRFDPIYM